MIERQELDLGLRRPLRLLGTLQLGHKWEGVLIIISIILFSLISYLLLLAPDSDSATGSTALGGGGSLALIPCVLCAVTGQLNTGWRLLPVTLRERRTAAWLFVSVVPFLFNLVSFALVVLGSLIFQWELGVDKALTVFGILGLVSQIMALAIILFAEWQNIFERFSQPKKRTGRDWFLTIAILVAVFGGMFLGPRLSLPDGYGAALSIAAIALCAVSLPLARRFVRLDPSSDREMVEASAPLFNLRLGGLKGHFIIEPLRALGIGVGIMLMVMIMAKTFPFLVEHDGPEGGFSTMIERVLTGSWVGPAYISAFAVTVNQQVLLVRRRVVLSLPRGRLLMLITPAINAVLVYGLATALLWGGWTSDWPDHFATGLLLAFAIIYLTLAVMLRATSMPDLMLGSLVISLPILVLASGMMIMSIEGIAEVSYRGWVALTSAIILAGSLAWCLHQLKHSRRPYRPWPAGQARWRGA